MPDIDKCLKALIEQIKNSEEYIQYHTLKKTLSENEQLYTGLNNYRKKRFYLQSKAAEPEDLYKLEALEQEYSMTLSVDIVKEFLLAELRFCRMMTETNDAISKATDFDLSFMDEPGE